MSFVTNAAHAQIIDSRQVGGGSPIAFTSLSVGWFQHGGLFDPNSESDWEFGGAPQFRVTLEAPMGGGAALGITGTTARVPLTYRGGLLNGCSQCDADANVSQIMASLHLGGSGRGFQQVVDASAGMTLFSNFRTTDGQRLDPAKSTTAFSFVIGYGFGFGVTERLKVMLVQDYGMLIHKRVPGSSTNTANQATTRVGMRYGLGSKRRGF